MKISVQLLRFTPVLMALMALGYIGMLMSDSTLFTVGESVATSDAEGDAMVCSATTDAGASTAKEVSEREKNRGLLVSLVSAFLLNAVGAVMANRGVPEGYIVLNYGFVLGPVIGYLLDVGIATEDGLRETKTGLPGALFALKSLASPKFYRYVITVFLDMFVSNPMQDAVKNYLMKTRDNIPNNFIGYGQLVKNNFPSLLQSIVAVMTFQAYTNDTRFRWAYSARAENRVANDVIMLATAVSASLFMAYNLPGAESLSRRVPFALVAIAMLSFGNYFTFERCKGEFINVFEATDDDVGLSDDMKLVVGSSMFAMFVVVGLVIPFYRAEKSVF